MVRHFRPDLMKHNRPLRPRLEGGRRVVTGTSLAEMRWL